jgi:hypothetical protein
MHSLTERPMPALVPRPCGSYGQLPTAKLAGLSRSVTPRDLGGVAGIQVIVTDVPTCGGAQYARSHGIDVLMYPARAIPNLPAGIIQVNSEAELAELLLNRWAVDFVVLAGYLKLVPASAVKAFTRRMLNIHPGLLPAFGGKGMYGKKVHQAVIDSGCRCVLAVHGAHAIGRRTKYACAWGATVLAKACFLFCCIVKSQPPVRGPPSGESGFASCNGLEVWPGVQTLVSVCLCVWGRLTNVAPDQSDPQNPEAHRALVRAGIPDQLFTS